MVNILQNKLLKRVAIAIAGILVVGSVAVGTGFLLTHLAQPSKQTEKSLTAAEIDQQMELGRQKVTSATEKAYKGETDAAISLYKEAIVYFQKAGDETSADAVQLEVEYLERVKHMSPATNTTPNVPPEPTYPDASKDPGYGVTATYPDGTQ